MSVAYGSVVPYISASRNNRYRTGRFSPGEGALKKVLRLVTIYVVAAILLAADH